MFLHKKWKFDLINEDLAEYYTSISNDKLKSLSVNDLWINFKHVLSSMMEKHIPTKMISPIPFIFHGLSKLINKLQYVNIEPMTRQKAQML